MKPLIGIVEWPYQDKDGDVIYEILQPIIAVSYTHLVLTVCLVILLISDNLNKEETPIKKPKKEKIETEEKIIDKEEKQELDKTISLLTSSDYCQFKIQKQYNNGCNFSQKEISSTDLEFKYKLYSLIMNFAPKEKIEEEININDKVYSVCLLYTSRCV